MPVPSSSIKLSTLPSLKERSSPDSFYLSTLATSRLPGYSRNMSHLIPTPRTDKNGVTSIRHMKPEAGSETKGRSIPLVKSTSPSADTIVIDDLIDLVFGDEEGVDRESAHQELSAIHKHSPETFPTLLKLSAVGTDRAHTLLREQVVRTVSTLSMSRGIYGKRDNWDSSEATTCQRLSPNRLRQAWNCGNVMEETGNADYSAIPGRFERVIAKELPKYIPNLDTETADDSVWRGIAAFTLTDIVYDPAHYDTPAQKKAAERKYQRDAKKFIEYAGKHKDINTVVRLAIERDTLDVADLKSLIAAGSVAPSLAEGAL